MAKTAAHSPKAHVEAAKSKTIEKREEKQKKEPEKKIEYETFEDIFKQNKTESVI